MEIHNNIFDVNSMVLYEDLMINNKDKIQKMYFSYALNYYHSNPISHYHTHFSLSHSFLVSQFIASAHIIGYILTLRHHDFLRHVLILFYRRLTPFLIYALLPHEILLHANNYLRSTCEQAIWSFWSFYFLSRPRPIMLMLVLPSLQNFH